MFHRIERSARRPLRPSDPVATACWEAERDALRGSLTPRSVEIQRALLALDEHIEGVEWCVLRIAATRERALRFFLREQLDAERTSACEALSALNALDAAFAQRLLRLLVPADRTALERAATAVRVVLGRAERPRQAKVASPQGERYGT